jgi:hypothetical protein
MTRKKTGTTSLMACVGRVQLREELHRTEDGYEIHLKVRRKKWNTWGPPHVRTSLQGITNWMLIYEFIDKFGNKDLGTQGVEDYTIKKHMKESEFDELIRWVDAGIVTARLS